ncbi:MAG: hypothetical protein JXR76_15800 [Deltaproteobacteria bacterium]|nr:hypothetical protein [Deltaproteobacteria bacterium]
MKNCWLFFSIICLGNGCFLNGCDYNGEHSKPFCTDEQDFYVGDVHITANTELEKLASCRSIEGSLDIRCERCDDLSPLKNLAHVTDRLRIARCPMLTSLAPLENVSGYVEDISIFDNDGLIDLSGLQNIQATSRLLIGDNAQLESLHGLEGLTEIEGGIDIERNSSLTSIRALKNVRGYLTDNIHIEGNDVLDSCSGLEGIHGTDSGLIVTDNHRLRNLVGLSGLERVRTLHVGRSESLTELTGLSALRKIEYLNLRRTNIENLDGLCALEELTNLNLDENPVLENIDAASIMADYASEIYISDCPRLTELPPFSNTISIKWLFLSQLKIENLNAFENLMFVDSLRLIELPHLITLSGLENLVHIDTDLNIENNTALEDISALLGTRPNEQNLEMSSNVYILENPLLPTCDAIAVGELMEKSRQNRKCVEGNQRDDCPEYICEFLMEDDYE